MATGNFWGDFRRWRRHRPFWGGLILMLAALELLLSANMTLGTLEIHLGPQGFMSYLLPGLLLLCGVLSWFTPAQRLFYGIVGVLTALYTFLGLNLGGFILGMLLGIIGGALVIAWGPPRVRPTDQQPDSEQPSDPDDIAQDEPSELAGYDEFPDEAAEPAGHGANQEEVPRLAGHGANPGEAARSGGYGGAADQSPTEQIEIAGHDDHPYDEPLRHSTQDARSTEMLPGMDHPESPRASTGRLGRNPRTLAFILLAVALTGSFLVAGGAQPASAEECPEGLPSLAPTTSSAPAKAAAKAGISKTETSKIKVPQTAGPITTPAAAKPNATSTSTTSSDAATSSEAADGDEGTGNPIIDGVRDIIDGVGRLLGIEDDATPSPSTPPTPSETSPGTADPEPTKTTGPTTTAEPTGSTEPSGTAGPSTPVKPTPSDSDIPCLGGRLYDKVASADDLPYVSEKPGLLKVDSLTMTDQVYEGVVDVPTKQGGTIKSLKFSMSKVVNKGFNLTIAEPDSAQTVIKSNELTTDRNVRFYTPKFQGKLFGLIPVTFTPDQPPPSLALKEMLFTDVEIQLAYVRCDVLTADPLNITEKS